mgnify:FL=1
MLLPSVVTTGLGIVELVALVDTSGLLASSSEGAALAVLVDGVDNPVDAGISADSVVLRVNEDNLEVLVGRVLVNPVRVKNSEVTTTTASLLLGDGTVAALVLELVDTLVGRLTVGGTLVSLALATTTADTDSVDDVALLGLVTQTASLVGAGRTAGTVDSGQLTVLPAADTENVTQDIALLVAAKLLEVFVGTHCV